MDQYIQKYLLQYHQVSIAGWGTMLIGNESAQIDFPNRLLIAGNLKITYNEFAENNSTFQNWLTDELKISSFEASSKIERFVSAFKGKLLNGVVEWKGWGVFKQLDSKITFTPNFEVSPASVKGERVIRKGAEHQVRVGEQELTNTEMEDWLHGTETTKKHLWWVAGLVLTTLGIILAVVFANLHNIQWKNFTNYHRLQPQEPPILFKTP